MNKMPPKRLVFFALQLHQCMVADKYISKLGQICFKIKTNTFQIRLQFVEVCSGAPVEPEDGGSVVERGWDR